MDMLSANTTFAVAGGVAGSITMDALDAAAALLEAPFVLPACAAFGVADDELETVTVLLELALASGFLAPVFAATLDREDFVVFEVACAAFEVVVESAAFIADPGECVGWSSAGLGPDSALGCSWLATLLGAATELLFSATGGVVFLIELALLAALRPATGTGFDLVEFPFAGALSTGLLLALPLLLAEPGACDPAAATNCRCFWLACASLEL
jgi:hypothetical protein